MDFSDLKPYSEVKFRSPAYYKNMHIVKINQHFLKLEVKSR